jgi:hypothetical protein
MYSHHSTSGTNQATTPKRDAGDVLLEIDNWKLIKARFHTTIGVDSYPIHMCGKSPEGYGVHRTVEYTTMSEEAKHRLQGTCVKCGERAPDEIMGLWTLHNWEVATR